MFKVQRFTCEDEEEQSVGNNNGNNDSGNGQTRDDILNSLVQRAKSRVRKRARVEDATSSDATGDNNNASTPPSTRATEHNSISGGKYPGAAAVPASSSASSAATAGGGRFREKGVRSSGQQGFKDNHDAAAVRNGGASSVEMDEEEEEGSEDGSEGAHEAGAKDHDLQGEGGVSPRKDGVASDAGGTDEEVEGLRPMEEVAEEWGLDARLSETLREEGVKHFFPIQVDAPVMHLYCAHVVADMMMVMACCCMVRCSTVCSYGSMFEFFAP